MRKQQVVSRGSGQAEVGPARRMLSDPVPQPRRAPRLVERDPHAHFIAQGVHHELGVLRETVGDVAYGPAAHVIKSLR